MEALGFKLREEAVLQTLTQDVVKTSEIEGEQLDATQVRSSLARRLGIDIGALPPTDRNVEGIVEVMLDATRNYQAAYDNPGNPVLTVNASGHRVMRMRGGRDVLLAGRGAGPDGERPFLAAQNVASGETERLWTAEGNVVETVVAVKDADTIVTRRQSRHEPPNHHLRSLSAGGAGRPLTRHADPMPEFAAVSAQTLSYLREDGLPLSGTLYLPPGYDRERDGRLPVLIWVYPVDYVDAGSAGQTVDVDAAFVETNIGDLSRSADLSRYVL